MMGNLQAHLEAGVSQTSHDFHVGYVAAVPGQQEVHPMNYGKRGEQGVFDGLRRMMR